jgi:uncharacterized protein YbaP (TraB family)
MNQMMRLSVACLALLLAAGAAFAQGETAIAPALPAAPAKLFLWKASAGGHTVYLLGSVHLAPESLYPLDPAIEAAYAASPVLVVEADIDALDTAKLQQQVMATGMYPAEQSLKTAVPPELYAKVESALPALGVPMSMADRMRPWLLALTVTSLRMQKLGLKPENGIDLHFLKRARGQKEILELESADFQLQLLSGFSDEMQRLFLDQTLDDPLSSQEMVEKMIRFWRSGDAAGMEDLIFTELREKPELAPIFRKMFDDRNGPMADKIEGYLKAGKDCLVIVGAGHLVGEKGILRLLEARGIHVEQE